MKKRKYVNGRALLLAALFSAFTLPGHVGISTATAAPLELQQSGTIKGTVFDETGETVIGATVIIKGGDASKGTITDFDGNFSIQCKPGTMLEISYIGYVTQQVKAQKGMKVVLKEDGKTYNLLGQPIEVGQ